MHDCGVGGSTAGPVRYHYMTGVLLQCNCVCAAQAGRLHDVGAAAMQCLFSVVLPFVLRLRTHDIK